MFTELKFYAYLLIRSSFIHYLVNVFVIIKKYNFVFIYQTNGLENTNIDLSKVKVYLVIKSNKNSFLRRY